MPEVSVIIPCYNQGQYLDEAVDSVLRQTYQDFEIIIVNDGSTDTKTIQKLKTYDKPKTRIINTKNMGLASARNNGIKEAAGKYILPLDADDKIGEEYCNIAVKILNENSSIGIVYCNADLFGKISTKWNLLEFSLDNMLIDNVIFCSAFFRKKDWEKAGGYSIEMIYGWEDYDFWLSLIESGVLVYKIPGTHFYYRINEDSMVRTKTKEQKVEMFKKIYNKHKNLYDKNIDVLFNKIIDSSNHQFISQLYIDTCFGFNEKQVVTNKISGNEKEIEFIVDQKQNIKQLRFDPINDMAVICLYKIVLYSSSGEQVIEDGFQSNALFQENNNFIFSTEDPQFIINTENINKIKKIKINLEFISVGQDIYGFMSRFCEKSIREKDKLIENLNQKLINKEMYINEIFQSQSWKITAPLRKLKQIIALKKSK